MLGTSRVLPVSGFRLCSDDWNELREFESVGDEFTTGDGRLRIVGIVGVPDDVGIYNALWKVESVSDIHRQRRTGRD